MQVFTYSVEYSSHCDGSH